MNAEPHDNSAADAAPKRLVSENDLRWLEAMREGDADRWRRLRHEANDPERNGRAYENLMDLVLNHYGRLPASEPGDESTALRITQTLAGRKMDTAGESGPG